MQMTGPSFTIFGFSADIVSVLVSNNKVRITILWNNRKDIATDGNIYRDMQYKGL